MPNNLVCCCELFCHFPVTWCKWCFVNNILNKYWTDCLWPVSSKYSSKEETPYKPLPIIRLLSKETILSILNDMLEAGNSHYLYYFLHLHLLILHLKRQCSIIEKALENPSKILVQIPQNTCYNPYDFDERLNNLLVFQSLQLQN